MSHPTPPRSRSAELPSRVAYTTPRQLSRLKRVRNFLEVEMPRKPEFNKGLSILNKVIDAEDQTHKSTQD